MVTLLPPDFHHAGSKEIAIIQKMYVSHNGLTLETSQELSSEMVSEINYRIILRFNSQMIENGLILYSEDTQTLGDSI